MQHYPHESSKILKHLIATYGLQHYPHETSKTFDCNNPAKERRKKEDEGPEELAVGASPAGALAARLRRRGPLPPTGPSSCFASAGPPPAPPPPAEPGRAWRRRSFRKGSAPLRQPRPQSATGLQELARGTCSAVAARRDPGERSTALPPSSGLGQRGPLLLGSPPLLNHQREQKHLRAEKGKARAEAFMSRHGCETWFFTGSGRARK